MSTECTIAVGTTQSTAGPSGSSSSSWKAASEREKDEYDAAAREKKYLKDKQSKYEAAEKERASRKDKMQYTGQWAAKYSR